MMLKYEELTLTLHMVSNAQKMHTKSYLQKDNVTVNQS